MKTLIKILLVSIPVLLSACDKGDNAAEVGQIYDYDLTKCACCGGYLIKINNHDYKFSGEDVSGYNPLNVMDIKFPLYVHLKWSRKQGDCADRIVVRDLRLVAKP